MDEKVHLINLDRSADRLREFVAFNSASVDFERFSAMEGKSLPRERLVRDGMIDPALDYTLGAIGNALSHREFWLKSMASGKILTVCEDGAIFNHDFRNIRARALQDLKGVFDFILWGWNFDAEINFALSSDISPCAAIFNQEVLRNSLDAFVKSGFRPSLFRPHRAFGSVCYTVSPSGAKKLLNNCFPLLNREVANVGIDVAASSIYPLMDAYVSFPPAVVTKNDASISTLKDGNP
jgi:GR25 family glycosyltransferase involved in LPS biosynthesis